MGVVLVILLMAVFGGTFFGATRIFCGLIIVGLILSIFFVPANGLWHMLTGRYISNAFVNTDIYIRSQVGYDATSRLEILDDEGGVVVIEGTATNHSDFGIREMSFSCRIENMWDVMGYSDWTVGGTGDINLPAHGSAHFSIRTMKARFKNPHANYFCRSIDFQLS